MSADGRENLPKMVVQVARHLAQGLLLHFNQFPGKHSHLLRLRLQFLRQVVQALEGFAIGLQRVESGSQRHEEEHADQQQDILGHLPVYQDDALARFLLRLIVQVEQLRDDARNGFVLLFELRTDQVARRLLVALVRQAEGFVRERPEVVENVAQLPPQLIAARVF